MWFRHPSIEPVSAQQEGVDWWVRGVPVVGALHVLGLGLLYARLGSLGLWLWYLGPIVLAVATAVLLVGSLRSARRWRFGVDRWQLSGYLALVLVVLTLPVYDPYPSSYDEHPSRVTFRVPFEEPATVAWGGATADVNYHVYLPDQRWAYDLLVTRDGRSFRGDGTQLSDYYAYGLAVFAPTSGQVFSVEKDQREVPIGGRRRALAGLGNHVGIRVGPDEYLFIGHFQPGSVEVWVGDQVTMGQPLGRVGNSGNSSEPHVHLHLQDTPSQYFGEAVPFFFSRYRHGGCVVERGMPEGGRNDHRYPGDVVSHTPDRRNRLPAC